MLLLGLDLYCAEPLALLRFLQLFLPIIGEYQKMSHHLSAKPLAMCHIMVNLALFIALLFILSGPIYLFHASSIQI